MSGIVKIHNGFHLWNKVGTLTMGMELQRSLDYGVDKVSTMDGYRLHVKEAGLKHIWWIEDCI